MKNESIGWHSFVSIPFILVTETIKLGYIMLREPDLLRCWPIIIRSVPNMIKKRKWIADKVRAMHKRQKGFT